MEQTFISVWFLLLTEEIEHWADYTTLQEFEEALPELVDIYLGDSTLSMYIDTNFSAQDIKVAKRFENGKITTYLSNHYTSDNGLVIEKHQVLHDGTKEDYANPIEGIVTDFLDEALKYGIDRDED